MKLLTQVGRCGIIDLHPDCCNNIESDCEKDATSNSEKLILIHAMSIFGQLIYLSYNESIIIFYITV